MSKKESNTVFALVRNTTSSPELTKLAEKSNVHIVQADITSLLHLKEAAKAVSAVTGGSLDVLINNAADLALASAPVPVTQLSSDENLENFKSVMALAIDVNVVGAVYVTNTFLPLIENGNEKKIIHTSTGLADTDFTLTTEISNFAPYSASKAMLNNLVARYGAELRPKGIHVVAISPGWVDTNPIPEEFLGWMRDMFRKVDPSVKQRIQPSESVEAQLRSIESLDWDVQGKMVSHHGNYNWF